jgi:NADH:ubiquinone oxidoreductase subunit 5 (subunit L)/multisubunit Na+/H+ antiporter MnhA subunit
VRNQTILRNIHDMPLGMAIPLMFLCFGSIFSGYFFKDIFVGMGTDFFKHTVVVRGVNSTLVNAEFIPVWAKLIPTIFSLSGLVVALILCNKQVFRAQQGLIRFNEKSFRGAVFRKHRYTFNFLSNKWYFDPTYNYYIALPFLKFAYWFCFIFLDQHFLKFFGPVGLSSVVYRASKLIIEKQQSGLITNYAFCMCYILLGVFFVIWLGSVA